MKRLTEYICIFIIIGFLIVTTTVVTRDLTDDRQKIVIVPVYK